MAQVWSELRPWTKAQEEHLDILVLSDLFYILVQERDRESTLFSPSVPGIARLN